MALNRSTLILTDWFYPGYKAGGPITSLYNMLELMEPGSMFKVFTRNTDWFDSTPYPIEADEWLALNDYKVFYSSKSHLSRIIAQIRHADQVFLNGLYSPKFNSIPLLYLLLFARNVRVIVSPRGMLNEHAMSLKAGRKRLLTFLLKLFGIESKVQFHAASTKEEAGIKAVFPKARITVVGNSPTIPADSVHPVDKKRDFVSIGRISPVKNTLSLLKSISKLKSAQSLFIGSHDEAEYAEQCYEFNSDRISFLSGTNRDGIQASVKESKFFVTKTTGENFGHSIIESLALGVPVIISDRTPWNDLEKYGAGWVIDLNDEARWEEILNEAIQLDESRYAEMSEKAIRYVAEKFDFNDLRMQYLKLFDPEN